MSFPTYPAYKNSGDEWLSEVPEHWEVLPLKHFAEVDNSGCYGVEPADGDHIRPVATTAQIDSEGRFDVGRMSDRGFSAQELDRYECSPGDVLIVKSSGSAENIISGKAGLVREDTPPFVFSNFLMRLRYRKEICLPSFLYSLLISHLTRERIKQMCSTTTYPNLQVGLYTSAKLPCPPMSEQTQIARFLDHETARIDALIEEQQRLIELLKEKRQAVISHTVTKGLDPMVPMKESGVEWIGEVPAHWEVGGLTRFIGPVVDYRGRTPTKVDDGIFLVTARNIRNGRIDYAASEEYADPESAESLLARGRPEIGDLLFTMEAPLGQVALIDRTDIALAQRIVKFRGEPNVMRNHYLMFWFMSTNCQARLETLATGSTALGIKSSKLGMIECLAPTLSEQDAIISHIQRESEKNDALVYEAENVIGLLQERRSALISAAVTGKIDVRGWQRPVSAHAPEAAVAEAV